MEEILKKIILSSFALMQKNPRIKELRGRRQIKAANQCVSFSWRKKRNKRTCTENEMLKLHFTALKKNNSSPAIELVYMGAGSSNRFFFLTFRSVQFFNAFLLRCIKEEE